jgi:phosphoribosyl 1,2-cyclic phosphodiesterase
MMRFASLGSGSQGNALVVEIGHTRLLLDCGFGISDVTARLARRGLAADDLDAIVVTHEHDDHIGGVARLACKHDLPVYLTYGTLTALDAERSTLARVTVIDSHTPFAIGDIEVRPYPVPHDAREPAQFVFSDGKASLGVLTDAGSATPHIETMLSGLDALVLECNHDCEMLATGGYPPSLKQRIAGPYGHLDNETAAELLTRVDCSRLQHFIAAHLSRQNNTPELARSAAARALACDPGWIGVADQREGFDWRQIV